jgi:hypothetical protein
MAAGKRAGAPKKLSRKELSHCITIWAKFYRQQDDRSDAAKLGLPSRPWIGRSPNSLKRFE